MSTPPPLAAGTAPEASTAVLALRGVGRVHGRGSRSTTVLEDIDLEVRRGISLGIVGESGAGKSTILRLLTGLDRPTHGTVEFEGGPLPLGRSQAGRSFRRSVQMVFQDPRSSLDPRMRVSAIIREPLEELRIDGDHRRRVQELLEAVGLAPELATRFPAELSGGQRQRVAIARALAPSPSVLIADEPVSALDVSVRAQVIDLLDALARERGMTMVMVSHDIATVHRLCERTVILRGGRIQEEGATTQILTSPRTAYTRRLLDAVPRLP